MSCPPVLFFLPFQLISACLPDGDWKSVLTKSLGRNGVLEFPEMGLEILFGAETFAFSWVDLVGLFLTG